LGPTAAGDRLAGQMDDGVHPLDCGRVDLPRPRIPIDLVICCRFTTYESIDGVSASAQEGHQLPTHQARGPGDNDCEGSSAVGSVVLHVELGTAMPESEDLVELPRYS